MYSCYVQTQSTDTSTDTDREAHTATHIYRNTDTCTHRHRQTVAHHLDRASQNAVGSEKDSDHDGGLSQAIWHESKEPTRRVRSHKAKCHGCKRGWGKQHQAKHNACAPVVMSVHSRTHKGGDEWAVRE